MALADYSTPWIEFSPSVPAEVTTITSGVVQGLSLLRSSLELVKTQAEAVGNLVAAQENAATVAANAAIRTLLTAVNQAIASTLDSTGLYVLAIPIPKRGLSRYMPGDLVTPDGDRVAPPVAREASNFLSYPASNINNQGSAATQAALQNSTLVQQIFGPIDLMLGGNAYFLRTVSESIFDPNDANKPRLTPTSKWAYMALLAGATDLTSIVGIAGFFDRMFGGFQNANHVGSSRGVENLVPRDVEVTPSGRGGHAIIQWAPVPSSTTLRSFDHSTIIAKRYAVIRSTGLQARTAQRVTDLFSTRELTVGLRGSYGAQVIAVNDYDGVVNRYVDTSDLTEGETYYYHVAFATQILPAIRPIGPASVDEGENIVGGPQARERYLSFDLLSRGAMFQKPVRRADYASAALGTAPDWVRTPSVAGVVPPIEQFIAVIRDYVQALASAATTASTRADEYVAFLNAEIARYGSRIDRVNQLLSQISTVFETPDVGVYATLRTGEGGISSVIASLAQALEETTDTAPPFLTGDEFVTGFFLLGADDSISNVLRVASLLQLFFTPGNSNDPALAGIQSVNTLLASVEANLVSQITGGSNSPAEAAVTFNADMTPRPVGSGDSSCD